MLANVYLHYVFDLWAQQWRRREVKGDMIVVRYADDLVVGFEHETEARRFWDAMRTRFEQFSLELHGEKTRLLEFGRYAIERRQRNEQGKPPLMATSNSPTCGHSNSPRQDGRIMGLLTLPEAIARRRFRGLPERA